MNCRYGNLESFRIPQSQSLEDLGFSVSQFASFPQLELYQSSHLFINGLEPRKSAKLGNTPTSSIVRDPESSHRSRRSHDLALLEPSDDIVGVMGIRRFVMDVEKAQLRSSHITLSNPLFEGFLSLL